MIALKKFKSFIIKIYCGKYFYLTAAFVLPFMLMWLIYIAMEVYPFGDNSVLVLDLNGQYVSFFEKLREVILNGDSLVYTWERALGGEFSGIFAYYIASPLSIIVALFPKEHITEALLFMFLIKAGLCGLTLGLYLHKTNPNRNHVAVVIFSTMYALSAYAVVQAHNTMWIDELILLPVLAYAIEQLIKNRKYKLYTVILAIALYVNFYIGFMMCIFVLFYFFYYFIAFNDGSFKFLRSFAMIGVFSIIAIAIAAVILLPAYYSLTFGKNTFSNPSYEFTQKFDFLDLMSKFFPGSYDTVRPTGLPFVYCGTLTLILLPIFFISSNIPARQKIMGGAAVAFFIFCFNSSTIDLIWHGFQKPNWLNYRYSFMLCFMIIVLAYRAFENIKGVNYKYVVAISGALGILLMVIQKQHYEWLSDLRCIWVSIGFIAAYTVALYVVSKGLIKNAGTLVLAGIVSIEMFSAGLLNITDLDADVVFTSRASYVSYMNRISPIINQVKGISEKNGDTFYRMEKAFHRKTNDPLALGYNGLSNSTSTLNASIIKFLNQMGLTSKSHWSKYLGGTPVSDALLDLKYVIYEGKCKNLIYNQIAADETDDLYAYQNPYVLSLAYAVNDSFNDIDFENYDTPFELMNIMVTSMLGYDEKIELFKPIKVTDVNEDNCNMTYVTGHKKYTPEIESRDAKMFFSFDAPTDDEIYMFIPTDYPRGGSLKLNGEDWGTILANDTDSIITLGVHSKDDEIKISLTLDEDLMYISTSRNSYFYYLDTKLYKEIMPKLAESVLDITSYTDVSVNGTITVPADRTTLFTTIPYDEGWIITVDGKEVPLLKAADSLLSVDISEGTHTVNFNYKPWCITYGRLICVSGIGLFSLIVVLEYVIKHRKKNNEYGDNQL